MNPKVEDALVVVIVDFKNAEHCKIEHGFFSSGNSISKSNNNNNNSSNSSNVIVITGIQETITI